MFFSPRAKNRLVRLSEGQLEATDPPYFEKTAEQRGFALEQLARSDLSPFPLRCPASVRVVELDIVLVPN